MPVTDPPDSLHFSSVAGTRFTDVEWHDEIGSTNTELLDRARRGAPEGMVLIADRQTAGRGRRGRRWTAPPGTSLMMSVLLRPPPGPLPPSRASLVTLAVGLAAADACEQVSGVRPRLKWPNDLVIAGHKRLSRMAKPWPERPVSEANKSGKQEVTQWHGSSIRARSKRPDHGADSDDRKLAGILAESITTRGLLSALVVGMGLNTGWPEVPAELAGVATSLNLEAGTPVDRTLLARRVLEGTEARYELLCRAGDGAGAAAVLDEARRNSATLGRRVRVSLDAPASDGPECDGSWLEGIASDLDAEGRLLITDDVGKVHTVTVGDVVHLRPVPHKT